MTERDGTLLVTGGAGYIGSHAVLAFREAGFDVVVLDNLSTGVREAVPEAVPLVVGDVGNGDLVGPLIRERGVRAVVHFAGSIVVPESVAQPLDYYRNNTAASRTLIQTCVENGVKTFVFSSTAAVYGSPERVPVSETAPTVPLNPYGTSKLMTEWMLRDAAAAHDFSYAALRYFNVAGADPDGQTGQSSPNATHLIKVACEVAVGTRPFIEIYGDDYDTPDGTCVRDYIHVSDLVAAHVKALARLRQDPANLTLNCGYGHGYSVREVLHAVEKASGQALDIRKAPRRPGDAAALVADASAIREALAWQPRHQDLDTIVRTALAWERKLVEDRADG